MTDTAFPENETLAIDRPCISVTLWSLSEDPVFVMVIHCFWGSLLCASVESWASADTALSMPAARLRAASLCLETWCWGGYLNRRQLWLLCWLLRHLHHLLKGMYKLDVGRNIKGVPSWPKDASKMTCFLPYAAPVAWYHHNNSDMFHLLLWLIFKHKALSSLHSSSRHAEMILKSSLDSWWYMARSV